MHFPVSLPTDLRALQLFLGLSSQHHEILGPKALGLRLFVGGSGEGSDLGVEE